MKYSLEYINKKYLYIKQIKKGYIIIDTNKIYEFVVKKGKQGLTQKENECILY